jgi:hypothetical protein
MAVVRGSRCNELFPRVASPTPALEPTTTPLPPTSMGWRALPGIGLDLSRVQDKEVREGNAGVVRRRANEALKEKYNLYGSQ